jgi:hypothetical protein
MMAMAKVVPLAPHHRLRRTVIKLYRQMVAGQLSRQALNVILVDASVCFANPAGASAMCPGRQFKSCNWKGGSAK